MSVSRIDVLNRSFAKSLRGYDTNEVDAFLQEVAETLGSLSEDRTLLTNRVALLEAELASFRERETTLRDTLMTTQRMTEGLKTTAQREAQVIVAEAQARAENIINQSGLKLARLQESILNAKKMKAQLGMRLRAVAEEHLRLLDMDRQDDEAEYQPAENNADDDQGDHASS